MLSPITLAKLCIIPSVFIPLGCFAARGCDDVKKVCKSAALGALFGVSVGISNYLKITKEAQELGRENNSYSSNFDLFMEVLSPTISSALIAAGSYSFCLTSRKIKQYCSLYCFNS